MRMRGVGIVWEEWRCTRNVLMGAFAFQALMIAFAAWRASHGMSAKGFVFLAYSVVPALIFILLFAQGDPRNVRLAFPKRRFLLPVSTSTLVLWPLVYRVLVVVAAVSLAVCASWAGYGSRSGALVHDAFQNLCVVLVAYAAIQTLAWVSPLFHGPVAALFGIVVVGPLLSYFYLNYEKIPIASPLREIFLIAASFALACVVSIWITQRLRWRGKTAPIGATLGTGRSRTTRFSMDAFRSPLIAQTWFEWRRFDSGSTLIVSIGILAAMGLVCSGMYLESNAAAPPIVAGMYTISADTPDREQTY